MLWVPGEEQTDMGTVYHTVIFINVFNELAHLPACMTNILQMRAVQRENLLYMQSHFRPNPLQHDTHLNNTKKYCNLLTLNMLCPYYKDHSVNAI